MASYGQEGAKDSRGACALPAVVNALAEVPHFGERGGVMQADGPNKLQCSLGHLFPNEAVRLGPEKGCVGGLFTFR